jgi:predicted nucleotidyltransferase
MNEITILEQVLNSLRKDRKILLAFLFGSYAKGLQHKRSDIDLAVYINADNEEERINIIDSILMSTDTPVEILNLNDEDESPFMVQKALKGVPLIEPDMETYYKVAGRALHESESIRFKREASGF